MKGLAIEAGPNTQRVWQSELLIHIGLGEKDLAFEWIRKACDERTALHFLYSLSGVSIHSAHTPDSPISCAG